MGGDEAPDARLTGLRVMVAGATGKTGRLVVEKLLAKGVPVVAFARNAARAERELPVGVEVLQGDVTQYDSVARAYAGCNAVICCTGSRPGPLDPVGPFTVDFQGTANLVAAAKNAEASCKAFVLVSSIGADDILFPLNLAWGVLFWKKRGEEALQRSGLRHTVVRPGGLLDKSGSSKRGGGRRRPAGKRITMAPAGTFGLPPKEAPGSILRAQVADVAIAALVEDAAAGKVVELSVAKGAAGDLGDAFARVGF